MAAPDLATTIARLRPLLEAFAQRRCSLCRVMTERMLFCRGFSAWNDTQLRERFHWFSEVRSEADRAELETLADRWQLADQGSRDLDLPCDLGAVAPAERCGCRGWQRFDDATLEAYRAELAAWLEEHGPPPPLDEAG